jgi:hypothetical protein
MNDKTGARYVCVYGGVAKYIITLHILIYIY